jgi:hypothetical protein
MASYPGVEWHLLKRNTTVFAQAVGSNSFDQYWNWLDPWPNDKSAGQTICTAKLPAG